MRNPITRLNATLEGRYRIQRQLGEGGMATVHLADDLRHQRKVALKVLKPELAAAVGAERFLAEIRTTANLQHPHILPLFDSGEADSFLFYVMPYVEGESLRAQLDREHQLPVDEVVLIAKDVAEALQAAHDHGVIHRDVKPANILMSKGRPLVSDFGIALALGAAGAGRLTETGLSLGTPHYMSPEQATGDLSIGAATDIYALGCVVYEMLVGEPPFTGRTPQAVLGKIVTGEAPSASAERKSVPPNVDAAIRRALEKVPADRFTSVHDFAAALADPSFRHGEPVSAGRISRRPTWQTAALVAVALGVGSTATALIVPGPPEATPPDVIRFTIGSSGDAPISLSGLRHDLAISRDGRLIVYRTRRGPSDYVLNVRPIDQIEGGPLRGTEGGAAPFFSPDGQWIGFVSTSGGVLGLRRVSISGGSPVTLAEPPTMVGLSWGLDDRIVFGTGGGGLFSVPGSGGEPEPLTTLDAEQGETDHVGPHVVDGHDVILFVINHGSAAIGAGELGALDIGSGEVIRLGLKGVSPRYTSTGHLVYVAPDETVRAVPFDIDGLAVTGTPVSLLADVDVKSFTGQANFDVSLNGRLVYLPEASSALTSLILVGGDGGRSVLAELEGFGWHPRFSRDGARVAYAVNAVSATGQSDLWVLDLARGARTRVTSIGENRYYPIWSPDGTRLTHATGTEIGNRLVFAAADGSGGTEALLDLDGQVGYPTSWSPDGRTLAYYVAATGTPTDSRDVWMLPLNGGEPTEPYPYVEGPSQERGAIFSPDGRWVAYVSDRSGRDDVFARPFPNGPGAEITLSVDGGSEPVWSPGGTELYYRTDTDLMVVSVDTGSPTLSVGPPRRIMADPFLRHASGSMANYDITPDGESFVMVAEAGGTEVRPDVHVVLNWFEELRARVPSN